MSRWTRRDVLKTGLAASASAFVPGALRVEALAPLPETNPSVVASVTSPRERLLLDFGWRFQFGHANDPAKDFGLGARRREAQFAKSGNFLPVTRLDFKDGDWRELDLPHDWAVELPFTDAPLVFHQGAKPVGREYPETSVGWYRRIFDLPKTDAGKRVAVEFDGVFRDATVMFNGHYLGQNESGYVPFRFDLTDFANFGDRNLLVVRVDATLGEGWFYEGAGIYRHVWLTKTDPLHLAQSGTSVRSEVRGQTAVLSISTEVENHSDRDRLCRVVSRIVGPDGSVAGSAQTKLSSVSAWSIYKFDAQVTVNRPSLWWLEHPNLYRLVTTVERDGVVTDRDDTIFGIRTIRFDADKGFFLNDQPVKIKGTCNHQDHAGVGSALPDRLQYFRVERLKEMGSNAYRASRRQWRSKLSRGRQAFIRN